MEHVSPLLMQPLVSAARLDHEYEENISNGQLCNCRRVKLWKSR